MEYVSLQVPEHLYLQALAFLGGHQAPELDGLEQLATLRAQLTALHETNRQLSRLVDELRSGGRMQYLEQRNAELERMSEEGNAASIALYDRAVAAEAALDRHESPEVADADPVPPRHEEPLAPPPPEPQDEPAAAPADAPTAQTPPPPPPVPAPAAPAETASERMKRSAATYAELIAPPVSRFVEAMCELVAEDQFTPAPTLHAAYQKWAAKRGEMALPAVPFGKGLSATTNLPRRQARRQVPGFDPKVRPILWYGIRLKSELRAEEVAAVRAIAEEHRGKREEPAPEPEPPLVVEPKRVDKPERANIVHVRAPQPARGMPPGVRIVQRDGKITTVDRYLENLEQDAAPLKPEDAPVAAFETWDDCKAGTMRPYTISDEVTALYGLDADMVDAAIKSPMKVEIRPESASKGYPVLLFKRGDLDVVLGFRTPNRPHVMACYMNSRLESDTHRVNHTGGGGKRASTGLPGTAKASVRALRERGIEISDAWESATQPIEVSYKGQVLGKIKVYLADKKQIQGDYQRVLRQAHAIDRRSEAAAV